MKKVEKIGVLCSYSFPEGMAPTTRIIAYGSGLVQNGIEVDVIVNSVYFPENTPQRDGEIKGVKYHYPFLYNSQRFHSKWYRYLYANWALYFNCLRYIIKTNKAKHYDYILFSFDYTRDMIVYGIILRLFGIKTIFIGDEYPEDIRQLKNEVSKKNIRLYKFAYHFISARILMTRALQDFYDTKVCKKPSCILSSVIDTSRFDGVKIEKPQREYLCYMGNLMLAKDNVDNIVRAFYQIKDKYPEIDLHLYGTPREKDYQIMKDLIAKLELGDRVIMKGRASYNDVPKILSGAKILVTSQPNTKRAEGGFPTKMCEYMMAEVPCILTDVGEISSYVTDGTNAFIVEPSNPKAYAQKLDYILTHYSDAMEVAHNAKKFVENNYGSKQATVCVVDFLNSLVNNEDSSYSSI